MSRRSRTPTIMHTIMMISRLRLVNPDEAGATAAAADDVAAAVADVGDAEVVDEDRVSFAAAELATAAAEPAMPMNSLSGLIVVWPCTPAADTIAATAATNA